MIRIREFVVLRINPNVKFIIWLTREILLTISWHTIADEYTPSRGQLSTTYYLIKIVRYCNEIM